MIKIGFGLLIGFVLIVVVVAGCAAIATAPKATPSTPGAESPAAKAAPVASGPAKEFGDGTHQVGVDIVAGRYKTPGPDKSNVFPLCSWSRNKDDSGEFKSIIANGNSEGPGSITVKKGEFVEVSGGCAWKAA